MNKVIAISERGQITIPTAFRKKLNVNYVNVSMNPQGDVVLSPLKTREEFFAELDERREDYKKNGGISLDEVTKEFETKYGQKL